MPVPDVDFRGLVLHEFGHALGLIHEHQSPVAGIQWDKEKVYADYAKFTPPWSKERVDAQVFAKYSVTSTNYSEYDPTSIMHYKIPASQTLNHIDVPMNNALSAKDKQYIAFWYPNPSADEGSLFTHDDCDEIQFKVEYGVEDKDKVRFILIHGVNVAWWKLIQIPIEANKYAELQVNRGWLDANLPSDIILDKIMSDSSRPIRFNKAKFWGIHTLLD